MDYEAIRANDGTKPRRITEEWFEHCLTVLPPANWHRGVQLECGVQLEFFRVPECVTADLYTWCIRLGDDYFEMIAPGNFDLSQLHCRLITAGIIDQFGFAVKNSARGRK